KVRESTALMSAAPALSVTARFHRIWNPDGSQPGGHHRGITVQGTPTPRACPSHDHKSSASNTTTARLGGGSMGWGEVGYNTWMGTATVREPSVFQNLENAG